MQSNSGPQERRATAPRESSLTATAKTQPRRQIHGGAEAVRYPLAAETRSAPSARTPRVRNWRATFLGALIGLMVVLVLLMKWLMEHQVEAAAARRAQEATVRAAAARCSEQASRQATDACLKLLRVVD